MYLTKPKGAVYGIERQNWNWLISTRNQTYFYLEKPVKHKDALYIDLIAVLYEIESASIGSGGALFEINTKIDLYIRNQTYFYLDKSEST